MDKETEELMDTVYGGLAEHLNVIALVVGGLLVMYALLYVTAGYAEPWEIVLMVLAAIVMTALFIRTRRAVDQERREREEEG